MMIEKILRKLIKCLECILMAAVYLYLTFSILECFTYNNTFKCIFITPVLLYSFFLTIFYYTKLLKKSPGSLVNFTGLEVRGKCKRCNRLESNRTFHCEACDKCYYKRDHHCPWVGKCIAEGNYKEFYFFIMFLVISLILRLCKDCVNESPGYSATRFFHNSLLMVMFLFFVWVNFLLCVDRTALEYHKNSSNTDLLKYRTSWSKVEFEKFKERLNEVLLDNDLENITLIIFPFMYRKAVVVDE